MKPSKLQKPRMSMEAEKPKKQKHSGKRRKVRKPRAPTKPPQTKASKEMSEAFMVMQAVIEGYEVQHRQLLRPHS